MNTDVVEAVAALDPAGRCLVALGGGADSAVLLAAAVEAFGSQRVVGIFARHGLEGSHALESAAEELGALLNVELLRVEAPVNDGPDLESRARQARYAALGSVLSGTDICCTGHTQDDQAETVLMRLMRGSGPTGLSGIPASRGRFRRPLLGFTRASLRDIAIEHGLPFTDDPANIDPRFLRSRIRNILIPNIEAEYEDSFRENLARSAGLVDLDSRFLDGIASTIPIRIDPDEVGLPAAVLATQPGSVAMRVIRRGLALFHEPYRGAYSDVAAVMATVDDGVSRTLSTGVACVKEGGEIILIAKAPAEQPAQLAGSGLSQRLEPLEIRIGDAFEWGTDRYRATTTSRPAMQATTPCRTAIGVDPSTVLGVRGVADGDRIDIEVGTTPVGEVLRVAGIPARKRPLWMVVTVDEKIAAVHGVRVAAWARPIRGEPAVVIEWEGHA